MDSSEIGIAHPAPVKHMARAAPHSLPSPPLTPPPQPYNEYARPHLGSVLERTASQCSATTEAVANAASNSNKWDMRLKELSCEAAFSLLRAGRGPRRRRIPKT